MRNVNCDDVPLSLEFGDKAHKLWPMHSSVVGYALHDGIQSTHICSYG